MQSRIFSLAFLLLLVCPALSPAGGQYIGKSDDVPSDIQAIFNKPFYKGALWGLRVVDLDTGRKLIDLQPGHHFYLASVRKTFTLGELINEIGPDHRFDTPVYRQGAISDNGTLQGDLILVASGDITMGGRTNPDGTVAISNFDHNEANELGNAVLTKPDPLAGYTELAQQIAAAGIKRIAGDVVIDDRLFQPYFFRESFYLKPIFVNDDTVDLILNPTELGDLASLKHRPHSAALTVKNDVSMRPAGSEINIHPTLPACIGQPGCTVTLTGDLPEGFTPPLTGQYPLIRTFRITDPSSYARTVLIQELRAAGVKVAAPTVEPNPTKLLPPKDCYRRDLRVALLRGLPFSEDAKYVNKVSYNIGADTSFLIFGLTQGVDNMDAALAVEKKNLQHNYGISPNDYDFVDGSGGGESKATTEAVTHFLTDMTTRPAFDEYLDTFPILGVDGSLGTVTDFEADPTLAPAKGKVLAKTGTYLGGDENGNPIVKCQSFGGYIFSASGRKLVYQVVVNGVPVDPDNPVPDIIEMFQDEGKISAILWRDN